MNVTASQIRELRELTGAGMMDCKRALERAEGDRAKAAAILKELGLVQMKKREDREVSEGRVFVRSTGTSCVIVRLACETDFVAKTKEFIGLGEACLDIASAGDGTAAEERLTSLIAGTALKIREHIRLESVRSLHAGPGELISSYVHGEGRIGVAVRASVPADGTRERPEIQELMADLALHAAAFAPAYLSREEIDPEVLESKAREYAEDIRALGKPEAMLDGIVNGKLEKFTRRVSFLEQPFIRDEKRTVAEVLAETEAAAGTALSLTGFLYESVTPRPS